MKEIEIHLNIKDKISGKSAAQVGNFLPKLTDSVGVNVIKGNNDSEIFERAAKQLLATYFTAQYGNFNDDANLVHKYVNLCKKYNIL